MAVYINGIKVAGKGISGKSPYQVAVAGGYTGSEEDFNAQLVAIGEAVKGFNELQEQVANAKTEINVTVDNASYYIDNKVTQAKQDIAEALEQIPNAENLVVKTDLNSYALKTDLNNYATTASLNNYALKTYVDDALASLVTDIFVAGTTAPSNTKLLWIDTTASSGGLKYYNGSAWKHVPVAWS